MQENFDEIVKYFESINLPSGSVKINDWTNIFDVQLFVSTHCNILKGNTSDKSKLPYFLRLLQLKSYFEQVSQHIEFHIP